MVLPTIRYAAKRLRCRNVGNGAKGYCTKTLGELLFDRRVELLLNYFHGPTTSQDEEPMIHNDKVTRPSKSAGSSSRLEEKMNDLQRQMSLMTDEIRKMAAILNEFANCRACIKKLYKTALEPGKSTVIISELPAETNPTKPLLTPPQTTGTPKPDKPEVKFLNQAKTSNLTPTTPMQKNAIANVMLIGSPSRGVYVPEARLESIKASCPKRFALKLFELVFGRDEAKDGSVEGKGEKLSRLDPNRLAVVHEEVERRFPEDENYTWSEIKRAIDEKCRMVRNNRCFVWAGVNVKSD